MNEQEMIDYLDYRQAKTKEIVDFLELLPVTLENKDLILAKAAEFDQLIAEGMIVHDSNPNLFKGKYCGDKKNFSTIVNFKRNRANNL